ncbi:hypothetical protein OESDEN_10728, partial [Oesophagostomum dentatum]
MNFEENDEDVTEAAEALEVSDTNHESVVSKDISPSDEDTYDIANANAPLFRVGEVEQIVKQYSRLIEKFQ